MSVSSMRVEKLHTELYEKMEEEQRIFIEALKTKTSDEILSKAYEYLMREDFLEEMERINLSEIQIRAMLSTKTPLADLYNKWIDTDNPHKEDIKCTINNYSTDEAKCLQIKSKRAERDLR